MNLIAPEDRPTDSSPNSKPIGLFAWLWTVFKELWCESTPLWFPLLSVIMAILAVYVLDQTTGILQALIDQSSRPDQTEQALLGLQQWHYWAFVVALCLWSFVNYQSTYLLHQFDYQSADYAGRLSDQKGKVGDFFKKLEQWSPVIAGLGPSIAVALGFHTLHRVYHLAEERIQWTQFFALYAPSVLIGLLIIWWPLRLLVKDDKASHSRQLNAPLSKIEVGLNLLSLAVLVLLVIATLLVPQIWTAIGPAATLCIIASAFVITGSLLVFWGARWRLPLIFITLAYCVAISFWNDNHSVRVARDSSRVTASPDFAIRNVFAAWTRQLTKAEPTRKANQKTPLFIICAEGGGVRAAYWTAELLAYLEDTTRRYPDQYVPFSSRVLAISGVSGGSLGAVTFTALLDSYLGDTITKHGSDWFSQHTANFLGRDQLSAPLATGAFIDTTQRLFPYPFFHGHDRAAALEAAWERAWEESLKFNGDNQAKFCRFDDDFRQLWRTRESPLSQTPSNTWIPSLFLNGTSVELGGRIIASDCVIPTGDYPGAQDALYLLNLREDKDRDKCHTVDPGTLRISTAINLSTRFPGISPSGELSGDKRHYPQRIVDGGYYDNSGARTAWDNLVAVYYQCIEDPDTYKDIIPWIIVIHAGPETKRQTPELPRDRSQKLDLIPATIRPTPSHFMVDLLAPARAFMHAWGSRSGDSPEALKDGVSLISQRLSEQDKRGPNPKIQTGPPLERVDYSIQTGKSAPASASKIAEPHHDPYVIELNLELDQNQIDPAKADECDDATTDKIKPSEKEKKKLLLPLGWMLPARARDTMKDELITRLAPKVDIAEKNPKTEWFQNVQKTQLGRVLSLLRRDRPAAEDVKPDEPKTTRNDHDGQGDGGTPSPGSVHSSVTVFQSDNHMNGVCSPVRHTVRAKQARN